MIVRGGTPHSYWNAGPTRARYVIVMGQRTAALVEAIHAMDPFDPARLPALFEDHDSELVV